MMYFCRRESYKNKTRSLDESEATGNQHRKYSVFSCCNQVNGLIFMKYLEFERIITEAAPCTNLAPTNILFDFWYSVSLAV